MQRKIAVVSTNDNDDYLFYLPIVAWAWAKLGWGLFFSKPHGESGRMKLALEVSCSVVPHQLMWSYVTLPSYAYIPESRVREETLAQSSRLYAANYVGFQDDDLIITSDVDMMPLSDYWRGLSDDITCYGRNLSDEHFPICYIMASSKKWKKIMNLSGFSDNDMLADIKEFPQSFSDEKSKAWVYDQDLVTARLNKCDVVRIDRPISPYTGYPVGRVDRSAWERSLEQSERIDAHLPRSGYTDENFAKVKALIKECFLVEENEICWMDEYRKKYISLMDK